MDSLSYSSNRSHLARPGQKGAPFLKRSVAVVLAAVPMLMVPMLMVPMLMVPIGMPIAVADFEYLDFAGTPTGLGLLGSASFTASRLRLTPNVGQQVGGAWRDDQEDISGGFDTTFTFQIQGGGADGFAFCVQSDSATALGDAGSGLGYSNVNCGGGAPGIVSSVVVEFDTWPSEACFADPDGNHVSIHAGGAGVANGAEESFSLGISSAIPELVGTFHTARIEYIAPATLNVYFDDLVNPIIEADVNVFDLVGGSNVWVGFTGATGGVTEAHDILDWSFTTNAGPGVPQFIRGDADGNGNFTGLIDGLYLLNFQFVAGSPAPPCMKAADADDSGSFGGLLDGLYLLNFQFVGGSPPPPDPGPMTCGPDPTADALSCDVSCP